MEVGEPISGLLCQENEPCLDDVVVDEDTFLNITQTHGSLDGDDEFVEMLVDREISSGFKGGQSLVFDNWVKCARLEAITWTFKTRAIFGFQFQTAYLSITYFDRFLSRRSIDSEKLWAVKLLSVACLSLAAKMEEIEAPALSALQTEEYNFGSKVIQRMELLVLNTLEWRMLSITPFAYLHCFIIKFWDESPPRHIVSRIVGFILAIMREINLMDHRPSVIAAASTLVALDQNFTRKAMESKMEAISSPKCFEIEDVYRCYNIMQKLEMDSSKTLKFVNSQCLSPTGSMDVLENSSVTSNSCNKRRRLEFSHYDHTNELHDQK